MVRHRGDTPSVAVIVPALNEDGTIAQLVTSLRELPEVRWVIVADNGSGDQTASRAVEAGAQLVVEDRKGYGYACAAGTSLAIELGAEILIYMDGDGSSLPRELPRLLSPLLNGAAELVLGSRTLGEIGDGSMPDHQRWGNWISSRLMRLLYGVPVTDLGPYRAIRTELLNSLGMQEMTFGWPAALMVQAAKRGASIVEVPVTWQRRQAGRSKVSGTIRGSFLAAYHIIGVTLRYAAR
jgi:glycosyltransferase involved in cell wall biosynthesis